MALPPRWELPYQAEPVEPPELRMPSEQAEDPEAVLVGAELPVESYPK
jgi:hypothetical protein